MRWQTEAGADLVAVYDPDPAKVAAFRERFPQARVAGSAEAILNDARIGWWPPPPCPASAARSAAR